MKKLIVVAVLVTAGAYWYLGYHEPAIITTDAAYYENVTGYLAAPDDDVRHPALVLIHEWWGLNEDIRSIARDYAQQGYVTLAVDLYDGEVAADSDRARELSSAVRADEPDALANLRAALAYLNALDAVDGERTGAVGWCFGGGWSYQMAVNDMDIDAAVIFYGQFDPEADLSATGPRILGHFGEEDSSIPLESVSRFEQALSAQDGRHEIFTYSGAGHAFYNYRDGENANYRADAARTARSRTLDFLADALR